jgi:hypothetical protein
MLSRTEADATVPVVVDLDDAEGRIRAAVLAYPPRTHKALLRVILAPQEQLVEAIGRLYAEPDGREAAEVLIDLEEDRRTALIVADVLKERPDRFRRTSRAGRCRVIKLAAEPLDASVRQLVVRVQDPAPPLVAELACELGRADDVAE